MRYSSPISEISFFLDNVLRSRVDASHPGTLRTVAVRFPYLSIWSFSFFFFQRVQALESAFVCFSRTPGRVCRKGNYCRGILLFELSMATWACLLPAIFRFTVSNLQADLPCFARLEDRPSRGHLDLAESLSMPRGIGDITHPSGPIQSKKIDMTP